MIKSAILQLYKQHHIKEYGDLKEGDYSCWGNYDSMSVKMVERREETLIVSRDNLGLADMWYQLSDMLGGQDGTYSQQCIGLLYKGEDDGALESFLEPDEYFCCACLIKLQDSYKTAIYDKLKDSLNESDDETGYVNSIFFRTMDNADAVILIKGNSYKKIMAQVVGISKNCSEILYTYSICGVNQGYLKNETWRDAKHSLMNDEIPQITSRIMANPMIDTSALEGVFGGNGEWAWVLGNTDIVWNLKTEGQTISQAIDLMRSYGKDQLAAHAVASHRHPFYGSKIYGITTEIIPQYNYYQIKEKTVFSFPESKVLQEEGWCRKRIQDLNELMKEHIKKNDVLYSYYLALIQSLTMIVPYEESIFARDLFYIIFPSLQMFHKQLDVAMNNRRDDGKDNILIKNITDYLEMLEQIIYRSIHSEQAFFMVPGYCGCLYPILPKLSMMYMAFLYAGIEVLWEDSEMYECCIYPVIDSKPYTTEIDFYLEPAERLIEIKVSQRSMYMANLMPILLLHELSHYVGIGRNREQRARCMIWTWGALLTKMLFWNDETMNSDFQKQCLKLIYEENNMEVREYVTAELINRMKREKKESGLFFDEVFQMLFRFSEEILEDADGILRAKIQKKGEKLKAKICYKSNYKKFIKRIHELEKVYSLLGQRLTKVLEKKNMEQIEKNMKVCFKETYADIISLYLIGFGNIQGLFENYLETFYLSEGVEFDISSNNEVNRIAVTAAVLSKLDSCAKKDWDILVRNKKKKYRKDKNSMNSIDYLVIYAYIYQITMEKGESAIKGSFLRDIAESMPVETKESIAELSITWHSQMQYFDNVVTDLKKRELELRQNTGSQAWDMFRNLCALLSNPAQSNKAGLEAFDNIIRWYIAAVDKKKKLRNSS